MKRTLGRILILLLLAACSPLAPVSPGFTQTPAAQDGGERPLPAAAVQAREVLSRQLQVESSELEVANLEAVEWPDACLGVELPGMACAEVITPGYRVELRSKGQVYEFHTDEGGGLVLLADAPDVDTADAQLTWESSSGICETASVRPDRIAFGACGGALIDAPLAASGRAEELAHFVETYAPFTGETPAGKLTFRGEGSQDAGAAEQRMIAEWARLVFVEAAGGGAGPSRGLVLSWRREGGLAGFCDDLQVYLSGKAFAGSCAGGQTAPTGERWLDAAELAQLYAWVDGLAPFERELQDPAEADAMSQRLSFSGRGEAQAGEGDFQELLEFASGVYASSTQ